MAVFLVIFFTSTTYPLDPADGIDKRILNSAGVQEMKQAAPDFNLYTLDGRKVSLKEYRGMAVFLHFWATWCKPCKEEMPTIEKMYREFNDKKLIVLIVSIDKGGEDMVRAYTLEFTFPVLLAKSGDINDNYWSWGIPVSYIIDRNGWIIGRAMGPKNWDDDALKTLIKEILRD